MKKIISIIIITLIIITGCALNSNSSTEKNNKNKDKVIYNSYDEIFSIEAYPGWQNVTKGELNKIANLEIVDYDKNKYFMALMEKKEDFKLSYDEYKDYMLKDIEKTYEIKIEETKEIEVGESKFIYVEFKSAAPNSSVNFFMQVYIVETKNYYGRLFAWTNYSQREKYKEEFSNMVKTFKEK